MNAPAYPLHAPALKSDDEEIARLFSTLRITTRASGDMALLADMLDMLVDYHWSDDAEDRLRLADDMADVAVKIRDCADAELLDNQNRFVRDQG